MRKTKKAEKYSPIEYMIKGGALAYRKRIDIPLFAPEHIKTAVRELEKLVEELKYADKSNSMRATEKIFHVQFAVTSTNWKLNTSEPLLHDVVPDAPRDNYQMMGRVAKNRRLRNVQNDENSISEAEQ